MAEERPWLAVAILAGLFATSAAFWQEAARRPAEAADGLDAVRWTVWTPAALPAVEVSPRVSTRRALHAAGKAAAFETVAQPALLPVSTAPYRAAVLRTAAVTTTVPPSDAEESDRARLASTRLVLTAPAAAARDQAPAAARDEEDGHWSDGAATATARAMSTAGRAIGKAFRIAGAKIGG